MGSIITRCPATLLLAEVGFWQVFFVFIAALFGMVAVKVLDRLRRRDA